MIYSSFVHFYFVGGLRRRLNDVHLLWVIFLYAVAKSPILLSPLLERLFAGVFALRVGYSGGLLIFPFRLGRFPHLTKGVA